MGATVLRDGETTRPRVAVVTVSYGSDGVLPGFLASIAGATTHPVAVSVADNASSDAIRRITTASRASYVPLPSNRGYGAAVNAAVAELPDEIDWVLISNPDVVLGTGSIDRLVATADDDDTIGAVGPAVLTDAGEVYPSARNVPSLRNGVGHALFANLWIGNPWSRAYRRDASSPAGPRDAGWLSGACVLVRRRLFDELGGFDEGYFMYFEDVDLGFRIGKAGWRNRYEPAATVTHGGAHSTSGESARMIDEHHRSARRFLGRKYRVWYLWPIRAALSVGLAVRSAFVRSRTRP